jgi:hypothetical protein
MIFPPILEDIVVLHILISIVFGTGLLVFLTIRRKRVKVDEQSDLIDALLIRIFLWMQLILGSTTLGGILIEKLANHTHTFPLLTN